ncbi:hypothetical protein ABE504_26735 [Paenibacillus oryzisoli]|uniref:hypothetical protein n=1 Tax=Paenibacillus oryzisoli TaxID=1850517 RepID=UPI003D2DE02C
MESRKTKHKRNRFNLKHFLIDNFVFWLSFFISIMIYGLSLLLWGRILKGTIYFDLLGNLLEINIAVIGLFMMIGYARLKYLNIVIESLFKILFTVWVALIVQFSSLNQIEQNAWIIVSVFAAAYLEVLIKINDYFHDMADFQHKKYKLLNKKFVVNLSIPLSIITLSGINIFISYSVKDLLVTISN